MERPVKKSRGSSEKATGSSFSMAQLKAAIEGGTIQKMTVVQLKDILATKGLSTAGRKVELIERIEEWIEESS